MAKKTEYDQESTKMWDTSGDAWDHSDAVGNLWVATLSIDEPNMEVVSFRFCLVKGVNLRKWIWRNLSGLCIDNKVVWING